MSKTKEWRGEKKKKVSFPPPWEFQTPLSSETPGLLINLPNNWLTYLYLVFCKTVPYLVSFLPLLQLLFRFSEILSVSFPTDPPRTQVFSSLLLAIIPFSVDSAFPKWPWDYLREAESIITRQFASVISKLTATVKANSAVQDSFASVSQCAYNLG